MLVPRSLCRSAVLVSLLVLAAVPGRPQSEGRDPADEAETTCSVPDHPGTLEEVLGLEGKAFFDAVTFFARDATQDELLQLLERCGREMPAIEAAGKDPWYADITCMDVVERVLEDATSEDLARVLKAFEHVKPEGRFGSDLTGEVLDRRLVLAALELPPAARPAPPLAIKVELPKAAARASREIRALWQQHAALKKLYGDYEQSLAQPGFDVQSRFPQFRRELAEFVAGRMSAPDAERAIGRYVWGGFCGTGADSLSVPQTKALLLTLLVQERYDLAAGAALSVPRSMSESMSNLQAVVFQRVLERRGVRLGGDRRDRVRRGPVDEGDRDRRLRLGAGREGAARDGGPAARPVRHLSYRDAG